MVTRYSYVNSLLGETAIGFSSSEDNSDGGNASETSLVLLSSISLAVDYDVDRI